MIQISFFLFLVAPGVAQEKSNSSAAIEGIKGVEQEAVKSVESVKLPAVIPVPENAAQGVEKVVGVKTTDGVKIPPPNEAKPVAPPPTGNEKSMIEGVKKVEGVKVPLPNMVKSVAPPPPSNAVNTIRAVNGVQGIVVPKQLNLEAALSIKEGTGPVGPKAAAAAAALFGPPGTLPGPPDVGDGREAFQEFIKQNTPGS